MTGFRIGERDEMPGLISHFACHLSSPSPTNSEKSDNDITIRTYIVQYDEEKDF